jgi:thiol:disulfide interchange protein
MSWKSYLLVFVMIAMGYFLRQSSLPKLYLSVLYTAIGTALFLSSMHYLRSSRRAR